jgi:thymidine phosphorylase
LITASILSKKLAANLDALVMDVKTGSGSFMPTNSEATALAESLVRVGCQSGLPTVALLTDMEQPLGVAIGNAIEVQESIEVLDGRHGVVRDLTIELCTCLLIQVKACTAVVDARTKLETLIDSGAAMERFERMVQAQGGDLSEPLRISPRHDIDAQRGGYVDRYNSRLLGEIVVEMGGGRRKKGDQIDHSVGVSVHHRVGDRVERGDPILTLHCPGRVAEDYADRLRDAVRISDQAPEPIPLVQRRIESGIDP